MGPIYSDAERWRNSVQVSTRPINEPERHSSTSRINIQAAAAGAFRQISQGHLRPMPIYIPQKFTRLSFSSIQIHAPLANSLGSCSLFVELTSSTTVQQYNSTLYNSTLYTVHVRVLHPR